MINSGRVVSYGCMVSVVFIVGWCLWVRRSLMIARVLDCESECCSDFEALSNNVMEKFYN
jgi:hypothetical protein